MFMFLRGAIPMIWGIGALVILGKTADSTMSLAHTLVKIMPSGIVGLACVGFVSATMSTFSSYLLAFSSILLQDAIGPRLKRQLTAAQRVRGVQCGVVLIGIFIYAWAALYHLPETVFRFITLTGSLSYAATVTVLVGGMYWKRANANGAYWAFAGSAILPVACLAMPWISPIFAGLLSFLLAPIGLIVGSLIFANTGQQSRAVSQV
jgi:SSS family solute:Na+ symporter